MIYTINNCIRAFGYTNFDRLIEDMGSVDNLKAYVRANGYADIAVAEDTELLLVDVNGKTWHTGCYGAKLEPGPDPGPGPGPGPEPEPEPEPEKPYLCFTSTGNSTISMKQTGTPNKSANKVIQYKLNDGQWQNWNLTAITLSDGDKMYIKSDDTIPISESNSIYKNFVMTGSIAASGNIMSLLNFSDTLTQYAFYALFESISNSTALTQAPELPATNLADNCYSYMFNSCASLVTAPVLPATTLSRECYTAMFTGCSSLTTAPALPATTLPAYCYQSMFTGCSSLTTTPALPATTLANGCYDTMFQNCTSLTQASALPATTLFNSCYANMFRGCTSLVQAPELPATTLAEYCYLSMFQSCSKLNYVKAMFTDISAQNCLTDWLKNVSATGTFDKSKDATWSNVDAGIPTGWTILVEGVVPPEPEPEKDYLCFTSAGNSTVGMQQEGTPTYITIGKTIQYKINNGQWQGWDMSAVTLSDGDKMYLKSDDEIPLSEYSNYNYIYKHFIMTGSIAASGNIMSLLNFSTTLTDRGFYNLFKDCTSLTTAPELPVTTLVANCYQYMFNGCTSLTQAPALPATTLDAFCYYNMFRGCTSLTTAPELPATTLVNGCYNQMFFGCTNLNYVKALFTTIPGSYTQNWLYNVSSTGTFVKNSAATWNVTGASGIPSGWTVQVEGGETPEPYLCFTSTGDSTVAMTQNGTPNASRGKVIQYKLNNGQWQRWDLSAVTLADGDKMYLKSDDTIPMSDSPYGANKNFVMTGSIAASGNIMSLLNFSTKMPDSAFCNMFRGCTSLTQAPELPAITLATYCYASMFYNCASLTQAPELPAITLANNCYESMFYNCTSLTQAPELPATKLADNCYSTMFYGCTSLTAAPELPVTKLAKSCYSHMFESCTTLTQAPALPATTLVDSCYYGMFEGCTSLTTAPELPATTLIDYCYYLMFYNCSKLNYVKAMFTRVLTSYPLDNWLNSVSSTGTFVKNASAAWTNEQAGIPEGWTVQTASPDK